MTAALFNACLPSVASYRKSHTSDPLHKCQFCNKTFTNMTKYLYHRRTHLNRDATGTPAVFTVPQ